MRKPKNQLPCKICGEFGPKIPFVFYLEPKSRTKLLVEYQLPKNFFDYIKELRLRSSRVTRFARNVVALRAAGGGRRTQKSRKNLEFSDMTISYDDPLDVGRKRDAWISPATLRMKV